MKIKRCESKIQRLKLGLRIQPEKIGWVDKERTSWEMREERREYLDDHGLGKSKMEGMTIDPMIVTRWKHTWICTAGGVWHTLMARWAGEVIGYRK